MLSVDSLVAFLIVRKRVVDEVNCVDGAAIAFGFEGSVVATVVMVIFTLIIRIVYRRKSLNALANIIK